jgi:hypothetical protein
MSASISEGRRASAEWTDGRSAAVVPVVLELRPGALAVLAQGGAEGGGELLLASWSTRS